MSGRRNNNIRGPHSALTDFLAANNISARQIREDYLRRQREAEAAEAQTRAENGEEQQDVDEEEQAEIEATIAQARRERERQNEKEKKAKNNKKKGKGKGKGKGKKKMKDSDDEDDQDSDAEFDNDMYKKPKKLPGQFANCEECEKRFTVTPYSKTGSDGGLLCAPCGKKVTKDDKSTKRKSEAGAKGGNKRRRAAQSERLDGVVRKGPKPLLQLCLEKVVKNRDQVENFDNVPDHLVLAFSKLFSKERVMTSDIYSLLLRRESPSVIIYDCARKYCRMIWRQSLTLP
jgi:DNA repair protein RAD7